MWMSASFLVWERKFRVHTEGHVMSGYHHIRIPWAYLLQHECSHMSCNVGVFPQYLSELEKVLAKRQLHWRWYVVSHGMLCCYGKLFRWHFLWITEQILSWLIHWRKPILLFSSLLLSATCGEVLSRMTEICMKNQSVSDCNCNTVNL